MVQTARFILIWLSDRIQKRTFLEMRIRLEDGRDLVQNCVIEPELFDTPGVRAGLEADLRESAVRFFRKLKYDVDLIEC